MNDLGTHSDIRITSDFSGFVSARGERIAFTRFERRALHLMASRPHRIFTRDDILDAISEPGSDKRDRNIDFLINRLRKKLGDNARNPRFIATRYGEGYVWIAETPFEGLDIAGADFVVGPITGLDFLPEARADSERFGRELAQALSEVLHDGKTAVFAPNCPPASTFGAEAPDRSAELSFFTDKGQLNCVVAVRDFRSAKLITAKRFPMADLLSGRLSAERISQDLEREIWRERATQPARGAPLPVAIFAASHGDEVDYHGITDASDRKLFALHEKADARKHVATQNSERRLRSMLDEQPQDAELTGC